MDDLVAKVDDHVQACWTSANSCGGCTVLVATAYFEKYHIIPYHCYPTVCFIANVWVCPITNHVWVWNLSKPTSQPGAMDNSWRTPVATMEFSSDLSAGWTFEFTMEKYMEVTWGSKNWQGWNMTQRMWPFHHSNLWLSLSRFGSPAMKRSNGIWEQIAWRPELKPFTVSEIDFFTTGSWHDLPYGSFHKWRYPKWMVYNVKWFGGTSILGNLHMYPFVI